MKKTHPVMLLESWTKQIITISQWIFVCLEKKCNLKHNTIWLSFYFPIKLIRGPPPLDPSSYGAGIDCLIHTDGLALG